MSKRTRRNPAKPRTCDARHALRRALAAVDELIDMISIPVDERGEEAMRALSSIGPIVVPAIMARLRKATDPRLRFMYLYLLDHAWPTAPRPVIDELIEMAVRDTDPMFVVAACQLAQRQLEANEDAAAGRRIAGDKRPPLNNRVRRLVRYRRVFAGSSEAPRFRLGMQAGREWADRLADCRELEALELVARDIELVGARWFEPTGGLDGPTCGERLAGAIRPDMRGSLESIAEFWAQAISVLEGEGPLDPAELAADPAFVMGFVHEGTEAWGRLREELGPDDEGGDGDEPYGAGCLCSRCRGDDAGPMSPIEEYFEGFFAD